jgi:hypothetical protein
VHLKGVEEMITWTTIVADALENGHEWEPKEIAKHLRDAQAKIDALTKQTKPLTKEEIDDLAHEHNLLDDYPYDFARAIEERHGIK